VDYGVVPIPKASNPLHIKQNLNIFDFKLDDSDTRLLRGIKPKSRIVKYEIVIDHIFYPFERIIENVESSKVSVPQIEELKFFDPTIQEGEIDEHPNTDE